MGGETLNEIILRMQELETQEVSMKEQLCEAEEAVAVDPNNADAKRRVAMFPTNIVSTRCEFANTIRHIQRHIRDGTRGSDANGGYKRPRQAYLKKICLNEKHVFVEATPLQKRPCKKFFTVKVKKIAKILQVPIPIQNPKTETRKKSIP